MRLHKNRHDTRYTIRVTPAQKHENRRPPYISLVLSNSLAWIKQKFPPRYDLPSTYTAGNSLRCAFYHTTLSRHSFVPCTRYELLINGYGANLSSPLPRHSGRTRSHAHIGHVTTAIHAQIRFFFFPASPTKNPSARATVFYPGRPLRTLSHLRR